MATDEGFAAGAKREILGNFARLIDLRTGASHSEATQARWTAHDFALFAALLTVGYLAYYLHWADAGLGRLFVVNVTAACLHFAAVVLARRGRQLAAALVAVTTANIQIMAAVQVLGWESGLHLYLIAGGVLVFVIFTERQAPWRWFFILGAAVTFIVCQTVLSPGPERSVPVEKLTIVFSINAVLTLVLVSALAGLFYQRTNQAKAAAARSAATAEYLANTDVLTGLSNRRPLIEALEARGLEGDYVVAIADLDHFKALNDEFGHQCGDRVLAAIASGFKDRLRVTDSVGRWGGEEFIVVLPHTGIEQGAALMELLREQAAETVIPCVGHVHRVTMSIGVADGTADGLSHHVVKRADDALYDAKVAGRDAVSTRGLAESLPAESYQENPRASRIRRPGSTPGR
ncbi:GGDEF domain-containing protein [Demequina lutea]|uniref:Diguanylate cyclase (GGDEF)-like protein n=1 Tax=Demequina lutea TaxID=431489 RepID=A0A7Y9ZC84_9MICO|nr:GGDEF domain-containing protein [Demequina lutea]NYI40691.1 diguanylate cyclase (GGDEF)-like protein [Demequina lutea]